MRNYLGRTVILVKDYDEAFKFYNENFGFETIFDSKSDDGQRFLHIGTDPHDSCGIWFLQAGSESQMKHVGNQTSGSPALVIYTTDLKTQYERLKNNKVKIKKEPITEENFKFFHCLDLYGNEIVITEISD